MIVHRVTESGGKLLLAFWCPGCDSAHTVNTNIWTWNGDEAAPTFDPSVKVTAVQWPAGDGPEVADKRRDRHPNVADGEQTCCHSFVRNGFIEFLNDSTHVLSGQTVELRDWEEGW